MITDRRKVFHSFHHAFKSAYRSARIEEEVHDALRGHCCKYGRRYAVDVLLEVLAEAVSKVGYRGLDLPHLHLERQA